mmetsp:Transcript_70983/g.191103  ORF Transcript_70983/g.191103 Transcript_70983/m.191103 type:complete len:248 (+) Transcript_70983:227-970(+)
MNPIQTQHLVLTDFGTPDDSSQPCVVLDQRPDVENSSGRRENQPANPAEAPWLIQQHHCQRPDVETLFGIVQQSPLVREDALGVQVLHILEEVALAVGSDDGVDQRHVGKVILSVAEGRHRPRQVGLLPLLIVEHLVLLIVPLLEILMPMRQDRHFLWVKEGHCVLKLRELMHLDGFDVCQGLPQPQRRFGDILELDLQDGEGEPVDLVLVKHVRGDLAPRLLPALALPELVQQGHLGVQGDPNLVA